MAKVKEWDDELQAMDKKILKEIEKALNILCNWKFFKREFPDIPSLKRVVEYNAITRREKEMKMKHSHWVSLAAGDVGFDGRRMSKRLYKKWCEVWGDCPTCGAHVEYCTCQKK